MKNKDKLVSVQSEYLIFRNICNNDMPYAIHEEEEKQFDFKSQANSLCMFGILTLVDMNINIFEQILVLIFFF